MLAPKSYFIRSSEQTKIVFKETKISLPIVDVLFLCWHFTKRKYLRKHKKTIPVDALEPQALKHYLRVITMLYYIRLNIKLNLLLEVNSLVIKIIDSLLFSAFSHSLTYSLTPSLSLSYFHSLSLSLTLTFTLFVCLSLSFLG